MLTTGILAVSCSNITSVSLGVAWRVAGAPESDLWYVAVAASGEDAQPFALQTAATQSLTLHDLLPATDYWLRVRAHPAGTGRNLGWDWGALIGRGGAPPCQQGIIPILYVAAR